MKINGIIQFDGDFTTRKYLFEKENKLVESVFVDRKNKNIICVSCMFGCPVKCKFCASGLNYFGNLKKEDMIEVIQAIIKRENLSEAKKLVISFMGSGEPALNIQEIKGVINEFSETRDNVTFAISNSGVRIENMLALHELKDKKIKLQLSLHSTEDNERKRIIPSTENLASILGVYSELGFELEFNYILLNSFNDSIQHAKKLLEFIKKNNFNLKINEYHDVNLGFSESKNKRKFLEFLKGNKLNFETYSTDGKEIRAACGQLVSQILK